MDRQFYGASFPHPGVEATVKQCNKLLMQCVCQTALGNELQTLLELLRIELGLLFYPFQLSYTGYGNRVLNCWLKRIWEKVDYVGFNVSVNNLSSTFPRKRDDWLMARVVALGYQGKNLITLNRVWNHQQVISLSDIISVGGGSMDTHYLKKHRHCKSWLTLKFPRERCLVRRCIYGNKW